ncbi:MAG TPA: glucoamylase family protein [Gemmatimonadaceae bacterium]|nr:glucoamylase family protein [Gemmatimonadaceae bacterium]
MTSALNRVLRARTGLAVAPLLFGLAACSSSSAPASITGPSPAYRNDPFLDTLETRTFRWFWDTANPANGLVPDRWPTKSFSSIAAVGFGLAAYPIGVERGYVSRADARARVKTTLDFLWHLPQDSAGTAISGYHGFFYHFLDMDTGYRFQTVELSTIDTSLLLAGILVCREYFDGTDPDETSIRALADSIYARVDWTWAQPRPPFVSMGWFPEHGFIDADWRGYDEGMILYLLALGSPTHPVDPAAWPAWTSTYQWRTYYGQAHVNFAPLFGHQYSQMFVDFRGIQDAYMRGRGIDYFENSRRATYAQHAYALDNPDGWRGYGADLWGLTASDGPMDTTLAVDGVQRRFYSYTARGAAATEVRDDGTIAPTAAGGSIAFAPELVVPGLKSMRARYGDTLFTRYGFLDALNPTLANAAQTKYGRVVPGIAWFDVDYLGIDQGPILIMTENYRTGLIWSLLRRSPYIRRGLERAGFTGGWL